jgi:alcohol dehydrogenase class IV
MAFLKFAMRTKVLMGEGVCRQIMVEASQSGVKKALLVTDEGLVKAGIIDRVLRHIDKNILKVVVFSDVKPDPSVKAIDKGSRIVKENNCDLIIAVGGGSPIDAAKGISVVASNGGTCADYEGLNQYKKAPLPMFAIPTTVGTGSEVTFGAVLTNTDTNYKFILYGDNLAPNVAFLDPELVVGIPKHILLSTAMDALTHSIESYISKSSTMQSRTMAIEAIRIIKNNIKPALDDTNNIQIISNMLYAANIAGIAFATSRLGVVHAMALPLGAFFHVPHGIANTILLPYGLEYNLGYADRSYCEMAQAMGEDLEGLTEKEGAYKLTEAVKKLVKVIGAPTKLYNLGVREDKIGDMARDTMKSSHIPANPRTIFEEDIAKIYYEAL